MNYQKLNIHEKYIIKSRGFYIKEVSSNYWQLIFATVIGLFFMFGIGMSITGFIQVFAFWNIHRIIFDWSLFIYTSIFGYILPSVFYVIIIVRNIILLNTKEFFRSNSRRISIVDKPWFDGNPSYFIIIFSFLVGCFSFIAIRSFYFEYITDSFGAPFLQNLQIAMWIYAFIISFTPWGIAKLFKIFHPLYAFGNFGEKIQKLTPQIEKKSEEIQKNFKTDMNFGVLSDGFDGLSSTFSQIVSLVIKLENVEARANKGNLFDSEKYINSLRSDIIEPLKSLKTFLEQKKEELLSSQEELKQIQVQRADPSLRSGGQRVRVKVGGRDPETPQGYFHDSRSESWGVNSGGQEGSGGQEHSKGQSNGLQERSGGREHAKLSSKRSSSLLTELTENIEKLDEMIGKIG